MVRAGAEASGAGRSHCNGWTSSAGAYNRRVNATARQVFLSGLALAVAGSVMFSAKAIVVKLAYRHGVDAETLLALRMLIAVPFFVVALWWTSRDAAPLSGRDHGLLLIIGLLGYYLASYFDFLGLQYITAALERLILYLNPTLVLLLSVLVLRRPVTRFDCWRCCCPTAASCWCSGTTCGWKQTVCFWARRWYSALPPATRSTWCCPASWSGRSARSA